MSSMSLGVHTEQQGSTSQSSLSGRHDHTTATNCDTQLRSDLQQRVQWANLEFQAPVLDCIQFLGTVWSPPRPCLKHAAFWNWLGSFGSCWWCHQLLRGRQDLVSTILFKVNKLCHSQSVETDKGNARRCQCDISDVAIVVSWLRNLLQFFEKWICLCRNELPSSVTQKVLCTLIITSQVLFKRTIAEVCNPATISRVLCKFFNSKQW